MSRLLKKHIIAKIEPNVLLFFSNLLLLKMGIYMLEFL